MSLTVAEYREPIVRVIGYTQFLGVPPELQDSHGIRGDQDQGSHGARLIECAGRCCYDSYGQEKSRPSSTYHTHIKDTGHGSVTEHVSINFYLDNLSRGLTHELVRHRAGTAISQRSTRYVDESESPWNHHPLVAEFCERGTHYEIKKLEIQARDAYKNVVAEIIEGLKTQGVDGATARKQARGAARGLLGNALVTSLVWTANIRALRNFLELRAHPAADGEIRLFANRVYAEARYIVPEWFDDYKLETCADGMGYALTTPYRKI